MRAAGERAVRTIEFAGGIGRAELGFAAAVVDVAFAFDACCVALVDFRPTAPIGAFGATSGCLAPGFPLGCAPGKGVLAPSAGARRLHARRSRRDALDAAAGRSWTGCGRGCRSAVAGRGDVVTRRLSLRRSAAGALCLASLAYAGVGGLAPTLVGGTAAARPRAANSCAAARAVPGSIPVAVHRVGRGTVFVAGVCIDGHGPFPFIVDSGSVQSVVATALARRLQLASAGPALQAEGISCRETVHPARIGPWSLGPIALAPQGVLTAVLPRLFGIRIDGLLGSDVLSRFGAVRLDAARHALFVAGPERSFAAAARVRLPPALGRGSVTRVPLVVVRRGGRVIALTDVAFGSDDSQFVVDTGAVVSVVSAATAAAAGLSAAPGHLELAAVGCTARLGEVHSGRWRLSGTTLPPERLGRLRPGGIAVAGLLGSDVLLTHGAAVLDYAGHALVLARG